MTDEPRWVTLGRKDIGFHEIGDNQGIEAFIKEAKCGALGEPWCAIWANAKLEVSGIQGTRSPSSQSFRHDPNFVPLGGPSLGAIAVFWRNSPNSGLGHVGFYTGETTTRILVLGGNESDAVLEQFEPKTQLIGYFWPKTEPLPQVGAVTAGVTNGHPDGGKVT